MRRLRAWRLPRPRGRLPRPRLPRVGEVLGFLLSFVIALAGVVGVILFFEARDESDLTGAREPPGEPYTGEPVLSPGLEDAVARGNVVVLHRDAQPPRGTDGLTDGAEPRLREIGLAVLLEREPTLETPLAAVGDARIVHADTPDELREFVDLHLGP